MSYEANLSIDDKPFDVVATGTCYLDINASDFPLDHEGADSEEELVGEQYETAPGGSAPNFCRLLGGLGPKTAFIGMSGRDIWSDELEDSLVKQGVKPFLIKRPELATNISFNMTSPKGTHRMRIAGTANAALGPEMLMPKLHEVLPKTDVFYLGGCFKLKKLAPAFEEIATLADHTETKLVIDHGRVPEGVGKEMLEAVKKLALRASYYLPSREEFCKLWDVETIEDGLHLLHERAPDLTVVVKDGSNGAFYLAGDKMYHTEAEKVDIVINATGAGDSFNAGVMAALAKGRPLSEAVTYGCRVAAAKIRAEATPILEA